MILTKTIRINITKRNAIYYRNKGYTCEYGEQKVVSVEDLNENAKVFVKVKCDICKKVKLIKYCNYYKSKNDGLLKLYACKDCGNKKIELIKLEKQKRGLLKRGDDGYWSFKENRLYEVDKYIKKYGSIDNVKKYDFSLLNALCNYGERIHELAIELGYKLEDIMKNKPVGYYDNVENIVKEIKEYINEYGRFPSIDEMRNQLNCIDHHIYKKFNTLDEFKDFIGYSDSNDLIDNRGDYNKSLYELYVANYLIAQGLEDKYKREQYPFKKFNKKYNYRSDFTFYPEDENEKEIHIEVWGRNENCGNNLFADYLNVRKKKEELYKKYQDKIILIGIEPEVFNANYKRIEENLYGIFKDYFNLKLKKVEFGQLVPLSKYNDDNIFSLLMECSSTNQRLPTRPEIIAAGYSNLISHIDKKYGGLNYFSKKYNISMSQKKNYWNEETIFKSFDYMINNFGRFLKYGECRDLKEFSGFYNYIDKHGTYTEWRLKYIKNKIDNNQLLHPALITLLVKLSNQRHKNRDSDYIKQHRTLASTLLSQLNIA